MEQLLYDTLKGSLNYDIYALKAPQNKGDNYAVYSTISDTKTNTLFSQCDLQNVRFQIDVYSKDYPTVKNISNEIQSKLLGSTTFRAIIYETLDINDDEQIGYRNIIDFKLWSK